MELIQECSFTATLKPPLPIGSLAAANALAFLPARAAARINPAATLRSE